MNQVVKDSFGFVEIDFQTDQTKKSRKMTEVKIKKILTERSGIVNGDRAIHGSNVESDCVPSLKKK